MHCKIYQQKQKLYNFLSAYDIGLCYTQSYIKCTTYAYYFRSQWDYLISCQYPHSRHKYFYNANVLNGSNVTLKSFPAIAESTKTWQKKTSIFHWQSNIELLNTGYKPKPCNIIERPQVFSFCKGKADQHRRCWAEPIDNTGLYTTRLLYTLASKKTQNPPFKYLDNNWWKRSPLDKKIHVAWK